MKVLSIVVPTYNVERYIDRCLQSLLYDEEILDDIEILIVNDGSKDNSLNIAKSYEKKYPKTVKVIDKENGGHGSTINVGLKLANGKFFRVIDSDDWVNIDDFSRYVKDLKKLDCDLVLTNYSKEFIYDNSTLKFKYSNKIEFNKIYNLREFDLRKFNDDYFFMATSTFKTQILREQKIELDENTFYVDMEFIIFPIPKIKNFILLDYDIYRYFIGRADQSINIQSYIKNRKHHEKVLRKLINFYEDTDMDKNKKEYIFKILVFMINSHYLIYCKNILPDKKNINELKKFDLFLKEKSPKLYFETSKKYAYINWNRKTSFIFSQCCHNAFSKIVNRLEKKFGGEK